MVRVLTGARRVVARLPGLHFGRLPDSPAVPIRDPWPGDSTRGAQILKGQLVVDGSPTPLRLAKWEQLTGPDGIRSHAHGFSWLRDLRTLGSDAARLRARALVLKWVEHPPTDAVAQRADVAGARIAAWLGHYDFFVATADDAFRHRLMARIASDARNIAASLPSSESDARALTALKGIVTAAVVMREHTGFLNRAMRLLPLEIGRQILPDGCHVERSPAAQLAALQDLVEIRAHLQTAQVSPPPVLLHAIERMSAALRVMRHGDGGLALFNGSREEAPTLVDLVLTQAGRGGRSQPILADGGFCRLQAGRTIVIVDCGAPPPPGLDRLAHAGTLSMELSVGRERLIVNCGALPYGAPEWRDATRATAAHSTLVINDVNSSVLKPDGLGLRPETVEVNRQEAAGAHWLEMSHDGWRKRFNAVHRRRLYMAESGEDIRGEDLIDAPEPQSFALRFHLHPDVQVSVQQNGAAMLLRLRSGVCWRLRADGARLNCEDSIYLGESEPRRTQQIVLTGSEAGAQHIKWALNKVKSGR